MAAKLANAGQYGYPALDNDYTVALNGVKTALDGGSYTGNATNYNNLRTWYEGFLAAEYVKPADGTFIRIRSTLGDKAYLKAASAGSRMTVTTTEDKNIIFLYSGGKLIAYTHGIAINNVREIGTVGGAASSFTFVNAVNGNVGLSLAAPWNSNTNYLYSTGVNGSDANRNTADSRFVNQNTFTIEDVTSLPVTISEAGYATLYAPVALTIPSGVLAYYISSLTTTEATLTEIETTIAANTPVILKATAGTYDFVITTGGTDVSATNKLAGQVTAFAVSADDVTNKVYYTLQQNVAGDAVGLFPKTAAGSIAGFKAYLPAANLLSAGVKGFTFVFDDDATGINDALRMKNEESSIYNLAGQRISKMQKGINIVNGKKILK